MRNPFIKLVAAEKSYTRGDEVIKALDKVNLELFQGDYVAIVGSSGSGKSTLLHVLGLLDSLDYGELYFNDLSISKLSEKRLAAIRNEEIGFVFQSFYLIPYLTALKNVELPLSYKQKSIKAYKRRESATAALVEVGLKDRLTHFPKQLSGGQQQRVAIARAIVNKPKLILADEPTGNLDSNNSRAIIKLFEELNNQGVTLVIVTHDHEIAQRAKKELFIQDGKLEQRR
jgi:putative ABC transport system ATP-binding protein